MQFNIYKNIPVSFYFITTWNQGVFLWSPCTKEHIKKKATSYFTEKKSRHDKDQSINAVDSETHVHPQIQSAIKMNSGIETKW